MKNLILIIVIFLMSDICLGQKTNAEKRLDSLFTALAEQNQFNGSVLIAEKGKVIYKNGKGFSNENTKDVNNSKTIFELGSCSKQFIGVGIVLLKREGKIDYTDDISKYLPELSNFKGVTIYDLLRHTSGIPEYLENFREDWKNERVATNQDVINYYSQRKDSLKFVPKSAYRYCNTNYAFLATIIERISNQKLDDYLSEKIFKPLRMNRTSVYNRRAEPKEIKNYAFGYSWVKNSFEKVTQDDPKIGNMMTYYMDGIVGAAKINSTVEDIYKWMTAIKNNSLLTQEEFNDVMEVSKTTKDKNIPYGFGFDVLKRDSTISYGHTGSWDGYSSFIYYHSLNDRTIIELENFDKGAYPYKTVNEILSGKPTTGEFSKKVSLNESDIKRFTGKYQDSLEVSENHNITYLEGHLVYNTDKVNWDMRFFPTSDHTFQAVRQGGADGVLKFTEQSDSTMKLEMMQNGELIGSGLRK